MRLDPRTKLLILAVTSVSVFMNKSIAVECVLAGIPLVLLSTSGNLKRMLKYSAFFLTPCSIPQVPYSASLIQQSPHWYNSFSFLPPENLKI